MQLVMYLGNDFIAAICLNTRQIAEPGYLGRMKRQLIDENSHLLPEAGSKPEFLVVNMSVTNGEGQKE
jgi:hypothetical protein